MEEVLSLSRPLEILYCWQALVVAVTAAGIVRFVKAVIDATKGEAWRKDRKWIELFLLPGLAVFFGALIAVVLPLRPEMLDAYLEKVPEEHANAKLGVYALWGGACGQFSSWIYDRVVAILRAGAPLLDNAMNAVKNAVNATKAPKSPDTVIDDDTDDPGRPLER
jgi:hypothetical protein